VVTTLHAIENDHCIICGQKNSNGLMINYEILPDGKIFGQWIPSIKHEGFKGIVHGGLLSTVIDEAMSKSIIAQHIEALTVELNVRFHHYAEPDELLNIQGWIVTQNKRKILTEGILETDSGKKIAHGWGTFLVIS
jgi:acyl-coenzyme A thioesterase PaaI-like protein